MWKSGPEGGPLSPVYYLKVVRNGLAGEGFFLSGQTRVKFREKENIIGYQKRAGQGRKKGRATWQNTGCRPTSLQLIRVRERSGKAWQMAYNNCEK